MSTPTTPSAGPSSGATTPPSPAVTAAQAITLAATPDTAIKSQPYLTQQGQPSSTNPAENTDIKQNHSSQIQPAEGFSDSQTHVQAGQPSTTYQTESSQIQQSQFSPVPPEQQPSRIIQSQNDPIYPRKPHPHHVASQGQPVYQQPTEQIQIAEVKVLGPLQPLPRGRPPRPKSATSPASWKSNPQHQVWGQPPSSPPNAHNQEHQAEQTRKTMLEPAYARGGHLLGGYNAARYPGVSTPHPKFTPEGKLFLLTGPNVNTWVTQISYIARALSCFDEMTKRFTGFPGPSTVQLFICETRFATAFRVLEASISGQVWAYMRVLGYSSIQTTAADGLMSPTPADCFEYANLAASKMLIPGTSQQPQEERRRMVEEILMAQSTDYPSERAYKKGINWLRLACDSLIRQGDYGLATSLYDPVPEWAPKPVGYESATPTPVSGENASATSPEQSEDLTTPSAPDSASPMAEITEKPMADGHDNSSLENRNPSPVKLVPEQLKSKKRKRPQKEEGPRPTQPSKLQPGVTTEI